MHRRLQATGPPVKLRAGFAEMAPKNDTKDDSAQKSPADRAGGDPQRPGEARDKAAMDAAGAIASPDRLLPGEVSDTRHLEDVEHWIAVYSELLAFKKRLLDTTGDEAEELSADARAEVERTDSTATKREAERLAGRLGFWRRRREEFG